MKNFTHHFNYKWLLAALLSLSMLPAISQAQNVLFQNFDGTTFPPAGSVAGTSWRVSSNNNLGSLTTSYPGDSIWNRVAGNYTTSSFSTPYGTAWTYPYYPTSHNTAAGTATNVTSGGAAFYGCYYQNIGSYSDLTTPPMNFSSYSSSGTFTVTFWVNEYYYSNIPPNTIDVYVNSVASAAGGTLLGSVAPHSSSANSNTSGKPNTQYGYWTQISYTIPAAYNSIPSVYITFRAKTNTNYAGDIQIDDVSVDYIPPCNSTPAAPTIISGPLAAGICAGTGATVTAAGAAYTPGMSYIWQDSVANGSWITVGTINNQSGLSFTTPGLFDTTYVRVIDSCQLSHIKTPSTSIYKVPVLKNSLPYEERFNAIANNNLPSCYTYNDNYNTNWSVQSGFHSPDGTAMNPMMVANDPAANAAVGKNDFFTLPGLTLQAGSGKVYAIRFKYARGKDNPYANTGTAYPEHLQVYANSTSPGFVASRLTSGTLIFDKTITSNSVSDTTIYFAPAVTGGYYLSWYSNTPHPGSLTSPVDGGTVAVDSIYVNLGTCVAPSISAQPAPVAACIGGPGTLSVTADGTGNSYQWKKNGSNIAGATSSSYTIPVTTATDAGNYSVAISNPCGSIISNSVALSVNSLPLASISPAAPTAICSADNTPVTAVASGNGTLTYLWKVNDTLITGATGNTYMPATSGNYSYIVRDGNGCTTTSSATTITVNPSPAAYITASGPSSFCIGDSVILNANSAAGLSYQWIYNGSNTSNTTAALTAKISGAYQVKVKLGNCSVTSSASNVTVLSAPTAIITAAGSLHFCNGGSVTLSANTGTGLTYQWRIDGNNINAVTSTLVANQAGVYDVIIKAGNCSGTSNTKTVSIDAAPDATVSFARPLTFCTGDSVVLSAVADATSTYVWKLNGSPIAGANKNTYAAYASGDYTVSITNANGCNSVSTVTTVGVNPLPTASIIGGASSICAGNTSLLQANTAVGLSYQWRLGFSDIPSANGANYAATLAGVYDVVITDANGCIAKSSPVNVVVNPIPNVALVPNGPTAFCPGGSVTLNATTDIGNGFTWYKDGVQVAASGASYTATSPGAYTVTSTSLLGCPQTSLAVTVINNTLPGALISLSGSSTFCPGGSVLLSTPSIAGYTYQWKNSAGNIPGATNSGYTANAAETYRVVVTSNNGCTNTSTAIPVNVISAPLATIAPAGPTTFCNGGNVVLNANTGSGLVYQWKLNGANLPSGTSSSYTATTSGSYTVDISNGACDVVSSPLSITVNARPNATVNVSGPTTFCSNSSVTLNTNSGSNYTYQWLRNGALINAAIGSSYIANTSGNYAVHVTNPAGCGDTSAPVSVTVNQAPVTSIVTSGATTMCSGDTVHLFANTGAGVYTYQWYMNSAVIPGAVLPSLNALATGTYTVNVTSTNGCVAVASPLNVSFIPSPVPVVTLINNGTALSTGSFATYQWYFNGKAIAGAKSATYTPTENGTYYVVVTQGTCIGKSAAFQFPSTVGISNVGGAADKINIYPNPATAIVHIDAPVKVNVSVSGVDGRVVLHADNVNEMNIASLANGIYMVTIYDASNNTVLKIEKLVKTGW